MREHTEALRPPRALWVPFMLGRPLGAPGDPAFQKRVMVAALSLLERDAGPLLEDFPEDALRTDSEEEIEAAACPVAFAPVSAAAGPVEAVIEEIRQLHMWHELGVQRRARTALGATDLPPEALARFIGTYAEGGDAPAFREGLTVPDALRLACEELKEFYFEARAAQPGSHGSTALRDWFWVETAAGRLLLGLHAALEHHRDPLVRDFAVTSLIPRAVRYRTTAGS